MSDKNKVIVRTLQFLVHDNMTRSARSQVCLISTGQFFFHPLASINAINRNEANKNVNFDYLWSNRIQILDSDVKATVCS